MYKLNDNAHFDEVQVAILLMHCLIGIRLFHLLHPQINFSEFFFAYLTFNNFLVTRRTTKKYKKCKKKHLVI